MQASGESLSVLTVRLNSLSPAPRVIDAVASATKKKSQKIVLLPLTSKFGPQEINSFRQLCA